MSELTPSKLKVVELRAELQARGLDAKGNKAVLVQRLEEALRSEAEGEAEEDEEIEEPNEDDRGSDFEETIEGDEKTKESLIEKSVIDSNEENTLKSDLKKNESHLKSLCKEDSKSFESKNILSSVSIDSDSSINIQSSPPATTKSLNKPSDNSDKVVHNSPATVQIGSTAKSPLGKGPVESQITKQTTLLATKASATPVAKTTTVLPEIKTPAVAIPEASLVVKSSIDSPVIETKAPLPVNKTPTALPTSSPVVKASIPSPVKKAPAALIHNSPKDTPVKTPSGTLVEDQSNSQVKAAQESTTKSDSSKTSELESNSGLKETSAKDQTSKMEVDHIKQEFGESRGLKRSLSNTSEEQLYQRRSSSRSPPKIIPPEKIKRKDAHLEDRNFENTVEVEEKGTVLLDPYNSDLNLIVDKYGLIAEPLYRDGFAFMWAGARSTHGVTTGKICFEVKLLQHLDAQLPIDELNPHVLRLGFSVDSTSMQLGEEPLSYGYGGTGKASTNCRFKDYGQPFVEGDVVSGYVDMTGHKITISFAKNGQYMGVAYIIDRSELKDEALFPHILTKNIAFEVNFGQRDEPFFKNPIELQTYEFLNNVPVEKRVRGSLPPPSKADCEMIMMCGLPGAGKTTWAVDYSLKNPKKKYYILGTNNIIDKMKVMGLPRKRNYSGRWDALIQMSTRCINKLFEIASRAKRNYILDQTNVYPSAQRRKMRNFQEFKRLAVVLVPTDEDFLKRIAKREAEEGKDVPDSAVLEMKANFGIPQENDLFHEILFPELHRPEAQKLVEQYNNEGRAVVGHPNKRQRISETPPSWGGSPGRSNQSRSDNRGQDKRNSSDQWSRNRDSGGYQGRGGGQRDQRSPGGFQNRGRGGGGGFQRNDSYQNQRGDGYQSPMGDGYQNQRGGYQNQRGSGYQNQRGGGGSGFQNQRGGFQNQRGDSNQSQRGGYQNQRGGGGGFQNQRGGGGYQNQQGGGYQNQQAESFQSPRSEGYQSQRGGGGYGGGGGFQSQRGGGGDYRGGGSGSRDNSRGSYGGGSRDQGGGNRDRGGSRDRSTNRDREYSGGGDSSYSRDSSGSYRGAASGGGGNYGGANNDAASKSQMSYGQNNNWNQQQQQQQQQGFSRQGQGYNQAATQQQTPQGYSRSSYPTTPNPQPQQPSYQSYGQQQMGGANSSYGQQSPAPGYQQQQAGYQQQPQQTTPQQQWGQQQQTPAAYSTYYGGYQQH